MNGHIIYTYIKVDNGRSETERSYRSRLLFVHNLPIMTNPCENVVTLIANLITYFNASVNVVVTLEQYFSKAWL